MNLKKLLPVIGIIILIIILIKLDFGEIINIFREIDPIYSILSFLILIPMILLATVEWKMLLNKQKIKVSFGYAIKNFFIGYFYGFITPGGFGAYTKSLYLQDESKAPLPKCLSNIIIFNTLDYFALLTLGLIGAFFLSSKYPYLFWIIIIVFAILLGLYLFFFKKEKSKSLFIRMIQSRVFDTLKDKLEKSIDSFYEDLPKFKDVLLPFFISLFGWILKYIFLFFIARLFGIYVPLIDFILIFSVADVIASIPISIYGVGTREAALLPLFTGFLVSYEQIVSFSLFTFVILWLAPSVVGTFVTIFETRRLYGFKLDEKTVKRFSRYMKKHPELYRNLAKIVKKNLGINKDKSTIVDLGVGPGLLSRAMNEIIPKAKIIGVDPSKEMLNLASENADLQTLVGTSENIPLKNDSVDLVVSRFSLTYWEKPEESLKEIHRVLKDKGKFVLEALNKDFPKIKLFLTRLHMVFNLSGFDIAYYHIDAYKTAHNLESVKKILEKTNFKIDFIEAKKRDWHFIVVAEKA